MRVRRAISTSSTTRRILGVSLFSTAILGFLTGTDTTNPAERPPSPASKAAASQSASPVTPSAPRERPTSYERALIVPIEDTITDITYDSLKRRLAHAKKAGVPLIVLEMDTPGGALGATLEICKALKEQRDGGVSVYAWINKDAYSAGTIIALAADGIVMARNATIGDCQPIMMTQEGASAIPEDIEAKATSPLLAELRDSARRNGYPMDMVMALIRPEMQIFWVENTDTRERRFVDTAGRNELFGLPDVEETTEASGDKESKKAVKRKKVTEPISDSKSTTAWRYVREAPGLEKVQQPIVSDRELLTMRTDEARAYGFSMATLNSQIDLSRHFNVTGRMEKLEYTWIEKAVEWLASPIVRGVLFLLMILGAYTEFQHPGLGLPGVVALIALVLFLGAPYMAGITVTWEIVAVVLGIVLVGVEIFVLPGFGVAGIAGILLILLGAVSSFMPPEPGLPTWRPSWPSLPGSLTYLRNGLLTLIGSVFGAVIGMVLVAHYLPRTPVARRMVSANPTHEQVTIDGPYVGVAQLGDQGTVEGILRPAGKARFGDVLVDVVSEGEFIGSGSRVVVIERAGNRIVVRQVP